MPIPSTTEQHGASNRTRRIDWFGVVLCVLLALVLLAVPVCRFVLHERGSIALAHAKTVRLAVQAQSESCYAGKLPFADQTTASGFVDSVYDEILMLSKAPGDVVLRRVGENGYDFLVLEYTEGSYVVTYRAVEGGWTVSYLQEILTP